MKKLFCIICVFYAAFPAVVFAAPFPPVMERNRIQVTGPDRPGFPFFITEDTMAAESISLTAEDPNFKQQGTQHFRGIPLSRILVRAGMDDIRGITVIGKDQYAVYLPWPMVVNTPSMIAFQADGNRIGAFKGGPLKLIFPSSMKLHPSAFAWYVETIVPDTWENPILQIDNQGRTSRIGAAEMDRSGHVRKKVLLSLPTGFKKYMKKLDQPAEIYALPVNALFPGEVLSGKQVSFVPYAGKKITISGETLNLGEVLIVYRINGKPVHPAHGGPFSVYFPILSHPDLADRVPDSAALFFLKEIIVR